MSEDAMKPVNFVKIGGVTFNSNDVAQQQTLVKNGAIRYSVFLKNGVQLEFPQQKSSNDAAVEMDSRDDGKMTYTRIGNLAYGQVKGTNKADDISLSGCNGTTVDVSGDANNRLGDYVFIHDSEQGFYNTSFWQNKNTHQSQNNKVITDGKDNIQIETKDTNVDIQGTGTTSEASLKGRQKY